MHENPMVRDKADKVDAQSIYYSEICETRDPFGMTLHRKNPAMVLFKIPTMRSISLKYPIVRAIKFAKKKSFVQNY